MKRATHIHLFVRRVTFAVATLCATSWMAASTGCGNTPQPQPGHCFSTPGPIGCCGPLAKAAGELQGIKTYGCANGRQRVYQAKFSCGDDNACKGGKYTAVVAGHAMAPSSCGQGFALFDIDDSTCPATW